MNAITNLIQDANLIVDCDEILVNISPLWSRKLALNKEKFEEYLDLSKIDEVMDDYTKLCELVLRRDTYYLTDWLKRDDVESVPQEIIDEVMKLYSHDKDFYNCVPLNKMAIGLQKLAYHPSVRRIYVITKCTEGTNYEIKERLIRSLFPERKLEIRVVQLHEKKSDYVKDIDIKNGFIFEDELKNIHDYLDNAENITECNIYVPKLGYNVPNFNLVEKAENKKVVLSYY